MSRTLAPLLALAALTAVPFAPRPAVAQPSPATQPATAPAVPQSPEQAVRQLFLGALAHDQAAVTAAILPAPHAEVLWTGEHFPPEEMAMVKKAFDGMTLREAKVGDAVAIPGNRTLTVTDRMIGPDRRLLVQTVEGRVAPVPLFVERAGGGWRVDARPIIAARLAAERVRQHQPSTRPGAAG